MRRLLSELLAYGALPAVCVLVYGIEKGNDDLATGAFLVLVGCLVGLWFSGRKARADKRRHEAAERAKDEHWLSKRSG